VLHVADQDYGRPTEMYCSALPARLRRLL